MTKEKQDTRTLPFGPEPPQANAGPDQDTGYEKTVTLDGSQSYNPNNIIQSYEWKELSGKLKIQDPTKPMIEFQSPITDQNFQFVLTVRGPDIIIDEDTVKVVVYNKNVFPIADAGESIVHTTDIAGGGMNKQDIDSLKREMTGVKDAITSLRLETKITNKDLNIILTRKEKLFF